MRAATRSLFLPVNEQIGCHSGENYELLQMEQTQIVSFLRRWTSN